MEAARQFAGDGPVAGAVEYGTGNVNDTFLVTVNWGGGHHFVLQRINQRVFRKPDLIMVNLRAFSDHVQKRLNNGMGDPSRRWELPRVLNTSNGSSFYVDPEGGFWRALSYIDHSFAFPRIRDAAHAREAGYALGRFQSLISDLDIGSLHDTLEGFHITPRYLQHYREVLDRREARVDPPEVQACMRFVSEREEWASVLENAKAAGRLRLRPIHGDPKVDNIMIDDRTGLAVSIVDLDTVKPGLVHYDIGDCLRSCCNLLGEETTAYDQVAFDVGLCREILRGYLSVASDFFTAEDYAYLYDSIRLIAFELGLRFFTDHLEGNVYFKVKHDRHNLDRALVQFKLCESIEAREPRIRAIIDELC